MPGFDGDRTFEETNEREAGQSCDLLLLSNGGHVKKDCSNVNGFTSKSNLRTTK